MLTNVNQYCHILPFFFLDNGKLNNDTAKLSLLNKEYTESAVCYFLNYSSKVSVPGNRCYGRKIK